MLKEVRMATRIVVVLAVCLMGCSTERAQSEGSSAPPNEFAEVIIRTSDSEFKGGAVLLGTARSAGMLYELSVEGRSSTGEIWAVHTQLDIEMISSGRGSASVQPTPAAVGVAFVQRQTSPESFVLATSGSLAFEITKGHISGDVTAATPENFDATFEGKLATACYVPATRASEGGGTQPDGDVLVIDETLENPACEMLLPWAPAK
jgi:hypothetical protein